MTGSFLNSQQLWKAVLFFWLTDYMDRCRSSAGDADLSNFDRCSHSFQKIPTFGVEFSFEDVNRVQNQRGPCDAARTDAFPVSNS